MPSAPEGNVPDDPNGNLPPDVQQLIEGSGNLDVTPMIGYLPPNAVTDIQHRKTPADGHLNDSRGVMYAESAARRIKEFLTDE